MHIDQICTQLYELLEQQEIPARLVWNKGMIMCNIFESAHGTLPENLREKVGAALREWVRETLPELPPATVCDQLHESPQDSPGGTPPFV
jgi:hypothetical protein